MSDGTRQGTTEQASLASGSDGYEPGDLVRDKNSTNTDADLDREDGMIVLSTPATNGGRSAAEWEIPGTGKTVADFSDGRDPDGGVTEVAFVSAIDGILGVDKWDAKAVARRFNSEASSLVLDSASVSVYSYHEDRLARVDS